MYTVNGVFVKEHPIMQYYVGNSRPVPLIIYLGLKRMPLIQLFQPVPLKPNVIHLHVSL